MSNRIVTLEPSDTSSRHLSSRIIPSIQTILDISLALLARSSTAPGTLRSTVAVLAGVVDTVPTFVGSKQLHAILRAAVDLRERDATSSNSLLGVVAKKVPTKSLFGAVMELWKEVQESDQAVRSAEYCEGIADSQAMEAFFHLLRLTLRNADRKALPTMVKQIFAFFLDVFDLRHRLQAKGTSVEVSLLPEGHMLTPRQSTGSKNRPSARSWSSSPSSARRPSSRSLSGCTTGRSWTSRKERVSATSMRSAKADGRSR